MDNLQIRTMTAVELEAVCESRYGWLDDNEFRYVDDEFIEDVRFYQ